MKTITLTDCSDRKIIFKKEAILVVSSDILNRCTRIETRNRIYYVQETIDQIKKLLMF